jgi:UDP-N-acetylglucosamine 3-dehydrogenase
MRAVVIGLGVMGSHHARVYNCFDVLHGVYDVNQTVVNKVAEQYHVEGYASLEDILTDNIDLVSIAVPTPLHAEIAKKCLRAGINVLLEKPISHTVESAQEIVDCAKEAGKLLAVGYIERFNPAVLALQELVRTKFFGDITSVNVKRVGGTPRSANNIILDLMTHDFNILISIFGKEPEHIFTHKLYHNEILNSAQTLLDFGTASATCESNWISPIKVRRIEVTGTEGYAIVNLIDQTVTEIKKNLEVTRKYDGEPLKNEIIAAIRQIKGESEVCIVSGEDALTTLRVTLDASSKGGYK